MPPPPGFEVRARPASGLATAALVCGIVGIPLFFVVVVSVLATVFGAIAVSRARQAPGPGSGHGRALAGLILGILGLVLFVGVIVVGGLLGWYEEDRVSSLDLELGQCVELDIDETQVTDLPLVDCDVDHQGEVFAVVEVDGDDFPGDESLRRQAEDLCTGDAFEDYIGVPSTRSPLDWFAVTPTEASWSLGDQRIACLAVRPDGGDLDESVRDSGD